MSAPFEPPDPTVDPSEAPSRGPDARRTGLVVLILALTVASLAYRLLVQHRLEQSAALFVGLPAALALMLCMTPRARSPMAILLKGVTLALLVSGIFFGEGFVCILFAAPLFYGVAVIIGLFAEWIRRRRPGAGRTAYGWAALPFFALAIEGVSPMTSFPRDETVVAVAHVDAAPEAVAAALAARPDFEVPLPASLSIGYPRPVRVAGEGLELGARRVVHMAGGEGRPGDLVLEVSERRDGFVRFRAVSDASHVAHWLAWVDSTVAWTPEGDGTRVAWTIRYRRLLDPAWYFGPAERGAVRATAGYLIRAAATPAEAR